MRKAVVLTIVMGIALVIFTLALSALYLMTNESRIAEHKIRRMRGFYAAQAGFVLATEMLRKGPGSGGWDYENAYCINGPIPGKPACSDTINDTDIPYNVVIEVGHLGDGLNGSAPLDITARYRN